MAANVTVTWRWPTVTDVNRPLPLAELRHALVEGRTSAALPFAALSNPVAPTGPTASVRVLDLPAGTYTIRVTPVNTRDELGTPATVVVTVPASSGRPGPVAELAAVVETP